MKIPEYLAAVSAGLYEEAFRIMYNDNVSLSVTGNICSHECQANCRRYDYDDPLQIRKAELLAVNHAHGTFIQSLTKPELKTGACAAVIGAGPAGIASAVFLRRNGVAVTVYEKRDKPYGAVQYLIPSFRIPDEAVFNDYQIAVKTGVDFIFNAPENFSITELKKKHKFVVIACGAWKNADSVLKKGQEKLLDSVQFLEESKKTEYNLNLGKKVAVIGGGIVAVNCARAAKRNKGVDSVTIIYRRTKECMRTGTEELEQALAEKINILELLSADSFEDGFLVCDVNSGEDGDNHVLKSTGEKQKLHFDTVINAAGVGVESELFSLNNIRIDGNFPVTNNNLESSVSEVYIAGSCRTGSCKTVNAIADGKTAAFNILKKLKIEPDFSIEPAACSSKNGKDAAVNSALQKKGVICEETNDNTGAQRCLSCNVLCEICVDVCPNRANVSVLQETKPQKRQIIHIDSMCNNCGNCAVFCPYDGKPYMDKLAIFYAKEDFDESENPGFLKTGKTFLVRLENKTVVKYSHGEDSIPPQWASLLKTLSNKYSYLFPPV
jgi:putative selenate reductase